MSRLLPFGLVIVCAVFVAASIAATVFDLIPAGFDTGVQVDSQGQVTSVAVGSAAWRAGVQPGWTVVAQDTGETMFSDHGNIRPVVNDLPTPASQPLVEASAVVALALAAGLLVVGLRRSGTTAAIGASAFGAPALAARLGLFGPVVALVPAGLAAAFAWQVSKAVDLRRGRAQIALAFGVVPPILALAVGLRGGGALGGVLAAAAWYLLLAWAVVFRWRAVVVGARSGPGSRLAVVRAVTMDSLPFADRMRRRGAQAERERLASDLHAELLPAIASTAAALEQRGAAGEAERLRELAANVRGLVSQRRLPILDDQGLVAAAEWLAEALESRAPIAIEIHPGDADARPPVEIERAAFRILQLALDNVIRHARATGATVEISTGARSLLLIVADDGVGIRPDDSSRAMRSGRLGLADMHAEAECVGATLDVDSRSPRGTAVTLRWHA